MLDDPIANERLRALSAALLSAAFAAFLFCQLSSAIALRSNLISTRNRLARTCADLYHRAGKDERMVGSFPIRNKVVALMRDVLILAKTDDEARELSEKYGLAFLVDP